jgi:prepilin-type processing-associated H-X9-DG protein
MSNELTTPKILFCPAETDTSRIQADAFSIGWQPNQRLFLSNSNLSYFVGIVSNETNPQMILGGDHNIANGTVVKDGMLELTDSHPTGWTAELHKNVGNLLLADGSVQQLSSAGLQNAVATTGTATNTIQMPPLVP